MPIKLSIDNNFLKVEGNDPERVYYERSRISHDIPTATTVQLRYDNNKLALLDTTTQDSTGTAFSSVAAIVTFLTTAGDGDTNATPSGGGGNSTLTQADVQTAMTNALLSQNQVEFQQSFLEDNNGTFIRIVNINEETGATTTTNTTLAGAPYTPVGTIRLASQARLDTLIDRASFSRSDKTYYRVMTGDGVNTSAGDYIYSVNRYNSAGDLDTVKWFNITTGNIAIPAPISSDLKLWNRLVDDAVNQTAGNTSAIANSNANLPSINWDETRFWAISLGAGYAQGDEIIRKRSIAGSSAWYNVRTDTFITTPAAANIVQHIEDAYVDATAVTVANTVDALILTPTFTTSASISVPLIGGKRANRVAVVRITNPTVSPLHADIGILFGKNSLNAEYILPLSSYNRPNQANIPGGNFYAYTHLSPDTLSVAVRNYNVSVNTLTLRFSWVNEDPLGIKYGYVPTRVSLIENLVAASSSVVTTSVDVKRMRLRVLVTGATTNVEFRIQQNTNINGVIGFKTIATLVVPSGTSDGYIEFEQNFRGGTYRISPMGTFTNYGYQWNIND